MTPSASSPPPDSVSQPLGLSDLLTAYGSEGFFFALVHVLLLAWFFVQVKRGILREVSALRGWQPGQRASTACTRVIAEFVEENQMLAGQGFLVPLTDFTDRLDSVVDGTIGRLHDLINLFLVVGIAGTVYGLFSFAAGAVQDANQAVEALTQGLRTAFPVAFMGISLYVFGYLVGSAPEKWLREAVADVTDRLLDNRRTTIKSEVAAIREALEPLRQLEATLTEVIEPVIGQFGQRLDHAHELVRSQLELLQPSVEAIRQGLRGVEEAVGSLHVLATGVRDMLEDAPKILETVDALYAEQTKRLEQLSTVIADVDSMTRAAIALLRDTNDLLTRTLGGLEKLPTQLGDSVKATMDEVAKQLPPIWREAAGDVRQEVLSIIGGIRQTTDRAAGRIEDAAGGWKDLSHSAAGLFRVSSDEALDRVTRTARQELPRIEHVFAQRFPEAVNRMDNVVTDLNAVAQRMEELGRRLGELVEEIERARSAETQAQHLEEFKAGIHECVHGLERIAGLIGDPDRGNVLSNIAQVEVRLGHGLERLASRLESRGIRGLFRSLRFRRGVFGR